MSRATMRAGVAAFFNTPAIAGLTTVYTSQPKSMSQFAKNDGDRSGMLAYVFIEAEREHRKAMGGATGGKKRIVYDVGLVCLFRHNGVDPSETADGAVQAMDDYDSTVELIKQRLRSDRTLGGVAFSAGEGAELMQDDIEIVSDLPTQVDGGALTIWSVVRFRTTEWIDS